MNVHHADNHVTIWHDDCLDVMRGMPDNSIDAIVTDPPYGLGFMGKAWDDLPPGLPWAQECLRILKPGGHLLAFGGTRTFHRLTCAIEDAGLEIRDSIAWLYGSGFPKSLDVSKAIDKAAGATREVVGSRLGISGVSKNGANLGNGFSRDLEARDDRPNPALEITAPATPAAQQWQGWGTALKPAFEPIVVARKPLIGTVAANVQAHGTGALNIDATRVAGEVPHTQGGMTSGGIMAGSTGERRDPFAPHAAGRWPTNVVLDGHAADELDATGPHTKDGVAVSRNADGGRKKSTIYGGYGNPAGEDVTYGGEGGPSRFFPTFRYQAKAPTRERPKANGIAHPTCKPLGLMRWLVRLTVGGRPDAIILDPFAGSGTTLEACLLEGARCIGIEREAEYLPLIDIRIARAYVTKTPADDDEDVS